MTRFADSSIDQKCQELRALHRPGNPLILPNAWDVASARAVVGAGFPVVATTSGGIAATLGYEDHEQAPADEMLTAAARIARSVEVPVTVDAEAGYGLPAADLIDVLLDAGVAGCNLEDTDHKNGTLADPSLHSAWLAAVREAANKRRYGLVINARVDTFLPRPGTAPALAGERLDEGIFRARAYLRAGADCVYPIFLSDGQAIRTLIAAVEAPVNILALPSGPSIDELAGIRVARISYGSLLHRRTMEHLSTVLSHL